MSYATSEDIAALYGQDVLNAVSARGDDQEPDSAAVDAAIEMASSEIDSYLSARYKTPLDPAPPYIKQICVDIAIYRMALGDAPRTVEMRQRYDDAIRYLMTVSKQLADIDGASDRGTSDDGTTGQVGSKAFVSSVRRG
jgi:phage gp36-like protein